MQEHLLGVGAENRRAQQLARRSAVVALLVVDLADLQQRLALPVRFPANSMGGFIQKHKMHAARGLACLAMGGVPMLGGWGLGGMAVDKQASHQL